MLQISQFFIIIFTNVTYKIFSILEYCFLAVYKYYYIPILFPFQAKPQFVILPNVNSLIPYSDISDWNSCLMPPLALTAENLLSSRVLFFNTDVWMQMQAKNAMVCIICKFHFSKITFGKWPKTFNIVSKVY